MEINTANDEPTGAVLATATIDNASLPDAYDHVFFEWQSVYDLTPGWYSTVCRGVNGGEMLLARGPSSLPDQIYIVSWDSGATFSENTGYDLRGNGVMGCP